MFVVFEGIDGSGKSSAAIAAAEFLRARGKVVTLAPDPGGTDLSRTIRRILLDNHGAPIAPLAELNLYCAARAQMVDEVIRPALARNEIVIGDRYVWSTLAYQGGILPDDELKNFTFSAAGNFLPDFTFLLDLPVNVALSRLQREKDRIENRGENYFENVRQRYLRAIEKVDPTKRIIIDAAATIAEINEKIFASLTKLLV